MSKSSALRKQNGIDEHFLRSSRLLSKIGNSILRVLLPKELSCAQV